MIDNFELIKSLFYFNEANNMFFHLQIVQRAKDHKGENKKVKESAIKTYFIKSREHLDRVKEEVIFLCEHYGARAYINVSPKSFEKLQKLMLVKLASLICEGNIQNPRKTLNNAAGVLTSKNPVWIVDVDNMEIKEPLLEWFDNYFKLDPTLPFCSTREELYLTGIIPTKQGCHLLVRRPFNLKEFSSNFPDVDVHKNSMGTLLYYPNSLNHRYVCSECGSPNIQIQAWVNANTNEYIDNITDDSECWCGDCMKHTKLKEV